MLLRMVLPTLTRYVFVCTFSEATLISRQGDLEEPNWQNAYWGSNYPRLKQLKQRYDPDGLLYARTTPGTENWEVIDFGSKLCKRI